MSLLNSLKNLLRLTIGLLILFGGYSKATHVMGGEISWRDLGNDSFLVSTQVYTDCNGTNLYNSAIGFTGNCTGLTKSTQIMSNPVDFTPVCANTCTRCSDSTCSFAYGIKRYTLSTIINVAKFKQNGCCEITISWSQVGRDGTATNSGGNFYTYARLNVCQTIANSSPSFRENPITIACLGRDVIMDVGGNSLNLDANGNSVDSLVYSLADPIVNSATRANGWKSPYNAQAPLKYLGFPNKYSPNQFPFGFQLDSATGQLMFRPMSLQNTYITILIEQYINGKRIGLVRREFPFIVIKCAQNSPPSISGINGSSPIPSNFEIEACAGKEICIDIFTQDRDTSDSVTILWNKGIPNATYSILNKGAKVENGRFCWTPDTAQIGKTFLFSATAQDNGCPINSKQTRVFKFKVRKSDSFQLNISKKRIIAACGEFTLSAKSVDGKENSLMQWFINGNQLIKEDTASDSTGFTYNFLDNGYYPIRLTVERNSCALHFYDTIRVLGLKEIDFNTKDTTVCLHDTFSFAPNAKGGSGPFRYSWKDQNSAWDTTRFFYDFTNTKTGVPTKFYLKATDSVGCYRNDSFTIKKKYRNELDLMQDQLVCDASTVLKLKISADTNYWAKWSGKGVRNNNFYSNLADTGSIILTYVNEVSTHCVTDTLIITNGRRTSVNAGNDLTGCPLMNPIQLYANPTGGFWTGSKISSTGYFNAGTPASGTYTVHYNYKNHYGCKSSDEKKIIIEESPRVPEVPNDTTLCPSHEPMELFASPSGGKWIGPTIKTGDVYYVDPSLLKPGNNYQLQYYYTDPLGCSNNNKTTISILRSPIVAAGNDSSFCFKGGTDTIFLNGAPKGGTWKGAGYASKTGELYIDSSMLGTNAFSYNYVDSNGCSAMDEMNLTLHARPTVNAGATDTVCIGFNTQYDFDPIPKGGSWKGAGITNPNSTFVRLTNSASSPRTFYYLYKDVNGCQNQDSIQLYLGNVTYAEFIPSTVKGTVPLQVKFKKLQCWSSL